MPDLDPLHLSRSQFAVVRAYLQGVSLQFIADRYMSAPGENAVEQLDLRLVQRTIQSYLHVLIRIAHQHDQGMLAGLLEKSTTSSGIGMQRAIDAVNVLERLGKIQPRPTHAVSLWFSPPLAQRLTRAGLATIADVAALANRRGSGWWRHVPRIGYKAAITIVDWLDKHQALLGKHALAEYVLTPHTPSKPASVTRIAPNSVKVVPLEWISVESPVLDGSQGRNRAPVEHRLIAANTDIDAISAWLALFTSGSHTWRAYRKEAERFLLWSIVERGCAVSDLTAQDCSAYLAFLSDPQPASRWIGPMTQRTTSAWRPFQKALGNKSQRFSQTVLHLLCDWLTQQGYLSVNPWNSALKLYGTSQPRESKCDVDHRVWPVFANWLEQCAQQRGNLGAQARIARAAILLLHDSALRREEICCITRSSVQFIAARDHWEIAVTRKRDKQHRAILSHGAVSALVSHWADRNLDWGATQAATLLAPLWRPATPSSRSKMPGPDGAGYSVEGLHRLVSTTLARFCSQYRGDLIFYAKDLRRHLFHCSDKAHGGLIP